MDLADWLTSGDRRDWQETDSIETTRFAIVGLGWWTVERALPGLVKSDFCEPTVVVSGSAEKAAAVADDTESVVAELDYDEFHNGAATEEYDAVYVGTPNATHLKHVKRAAELGKDVCCEKPLEINHHRARAMVDICDEMDVILTVAYRMQTEPAVRRARELIAEGLIGDPVSVVSHISNLLGVTNPEDQWRLDVDLAGGCSLIGIGIYPLNTARFVLNMDPTAVQGMTTSSTDIFGEVDERVAFNVEFPDGVLLTATASHNAAWHSQFKVVGTEGVLCIEPAFAAVEDRVIRIERGEARAKLSFEWIDQMKEEFDHFAYCRKTDRDPVATGGHGVVDIEAIEAIYESAASGRRVDLTD